MLMSSMLIGASLAASPVPPAARQDVIPQDRYPALWVINDADTVIYLFGTFHALDSRSEWFGQAVKTAFTESDQLILETLVPRPELAPPPPPPVGAGNIERIPVARSSFLGDSNAVMKAGRSNGLSYDHGADAVLRYAAAAAGKPVGELESFAFQIRMFSALPPAPQAGAQMVNGEDGMAALLTQLKAAWNRGDIDSFSPMLMKMRDQSPQMYRTLFVERNSRWAQWIAQRLETPGTVFVAVGAGHLSGPDSVQNQLAWRGVRSARVN
ncbi:TraB/GumN family protein [Sphingomonas sabuli]|uniref:TraB/GumN family protein n=1 Tax=Sphingomonas sabuli TaxID=2764186 RepID=A0A7G9L2M5_9SPHN|nr:TraB/GumN family protein [Sphingomonas sabuli]QNM82874.1 TraB/GumN family protein [Sphingomonas sabuli]